MTSSTNLEWVFITNKADRGVFQAIEQKSLDFERLTALHFPTILLAKLDK